RSLGSSEGRVLAGVLADPSDHASLARCSPRFCVPSKRICLMPQFINSLLWHQQLLKLDQLVNLEYVARDNVFISPLGKVFKCFALQLFSRSSSALFWFLAAMSNLALK